MLEQSVPEGLYPMERTHTGAVLEELQSVGKTHTEAACAGLYPVGGCPRWFWGAV